MASKKKSGEARAFAGFGESKIHAAPEGAFAPDNWDDYTVEGQAIPPHMRSLMTFAMTDQGKAQAEKEIEARGGRAAVEFTRDAQDKLIDEYGDRLDSRKGLILTQDPLQVLMDRHLPKGYRGRWLGKRKMAEAGMIRGPVEYEPLLVDNPDKPGEKMTVTLGGMILAVIPEELAKEAQQFYADIEKENRIAVNDKVNEYNDKHVGPDRLERAARRRGKLEDLVGEQDDTERAGIDLDRDLQTLEVEV